MPESITVVGADGKIWCATTFTEVVPPTEVTTETMHATGVRIEESDGSSQEFVPTPEVAPETPADTTDTPAE